MIYNYRKELPMETPANTITIRNVMRVFADSNHDDIVTKAEWDATTAYSKDKINADRFVAIRPVGNDDSTETHVAWETARGVSEMPSPLFYEGRIHFIRDGGLWSVLEAKTGKRLVDRERLGIGGQAVASPIAANGYIYVVSETGTFAVLRSGDLLEIVAVNKLDESVRSTPVVAGNTLYIRTADHLWAFGQK